MTIPSLTLPPDTPQRSDPATFPAKADAYVSWQADTNAPEMVATVTAINTTVATMSAIAAGGAMTLPYTFSSTTTDADPGAGFVRLSSATQNASTVIRLDLVGADGSTWTDVISTFDDSTSTVKGYILLQKLTDATKWLEFSVSSLASPAGYKNLTVVPVASSAASPFADGDSLVLKFTANGDKGDVGPGGALVLLATLTPTAAANVDFLTTFTSGYDNYLVIGQGLKPATSTRLCIRLANAGAADGGNNYFIPAPDATTSSPGSECRINTSNTLPAGTGVDFVANILNANSAADMKFVSIQSMSNQDATPTYAHRGIPCAYAGVAVSGFRLYWESAANFAATGKVRVYGYSNT